MMRKMIFLTMLSVLLVLFPTACTEKNPAADSGASQTENGTNTAETEPAAAEQLTVRFGDNGAPFTMYLEDNDTVAAIAHHVGSTD